MKNIFLIILVILFTNSVFAQNQKERVGLFKKWYVGAFPEVIGHYSFEKDSVSHDSVNIVITKDTIFYDNNIFPVVYTVEAKTKIHYYRIFCENKNYHSLSLYMYPRGILGWKIILEDFDTNDINKNGWEGIWKRREPEVYKY